MIVCVLGRNGDEEALHEDVAAVVLDADGFVRLCRDGREDEFLDNKRIVVTG